MKPDTRRVGSEIQFTFTFRSDFLEQRWRVACVAHKGYHNVAHKGYHNVSHQQELNFNDIGCCKKLKGAFSSSAKSWLNSITL